MASPLLFEQAKTQWNLDKLYADLAQAKSEVLPHARSSVLTELERSRLRGLLLGYSPTDIADYQYVVEGTVEVALSNGIYRYVERLTGRDRNSLESWRDVATWLQQAGYSASQVMINWSQMPHVPKLYGRQAELQQLKDWALDHSSAGAQAAQPGLSTRLIAVNGPAGIGKTSLVIELAKAIQPEFEGVIWQSLRYRPRLEEIFEQWLAQLPGQAADASTVLQSAQPSSCYDQLTVLMDYFRAHRCLVILDNFETLLTGGSFMGEYEPGYEAYGELLRRVGEQQHQSCIVVTSREGNRDMPKSRASSSPIRHLDLAGLQPQAAMEILKAEQLAETGQSHWSMLINQYRGNPLMLRIVAMTIHELFEGSVRRFLGQRMTLFGDIKYLINQQYERLSSEEQDILVHLADAAEPVPLESLTQPYRLDAVKGLLGRSLIEKSSAGFTLIPVVMEYVRHHLP